MAYNAPFAPTANTVALTTSSTASTAQSRQLTPQNLGAAASTPFMPPHVHALNPGATGVWVSFTSVTSVIAIPAAGTGTSIGTPEYAIYLPPNMLVPLALTVPAGPAVWVNDISTGTSITYYLSFGEGR